MSEQLEIPFTQGVSQNQELIEAIKKELRLPGITKALRKKLTMGLSAAKSGALKEQK